VLIIDVPPPRPILTIATFAAEVAQSARVVLLIGDTDTGKTTLATAIANAALTAGRRVAVVDSDIGQSEIGPPATVGMGFIERPVRALAEVAPTALAFVGTTSAAVRRRPHVDSTRRLVSEARILGAELVIVDTIGFVTGESAQRLKRAKLAALRPDRTIVLQREHECAEILEYLRHRKYTNVTALPIPDGVRAKSAARRAAHRVSGFRDILTRDAERTFALDRIRSYGGWLFTASPGDEALARDATAQLRAPVTHAEAMPERIALVVDGTVSPRELLELRSRYRPRRMTITPAAWYNNLLVGLEDAHGALIGVGLCLAIDFAAFTVRVVTTLNDPETVRAIHTGLVRIAPGGRELGTPREGDV
jgi:polynucleotide 5'-hydroxyl-kinase GRC3/NOL9